MSGAPHTVREMVPLGPLTTIGLGGPARYFVSCATGEECRWALAFARERGLPVFILGGGSNTLFPDEGFSGLVLHIGITGLAFSESPEGTVVTVGAGVAWDDLVSTCVDRGLGGIECLAGIPGTTGATPLQNVGAYGQEVGDSVLSVHAIDVTTDSDCVFPSSECGFRYRWSRFKGNDAGRYLITSVTFRFEPEARPRIRYPELLRALSEHGPAESPAPGKPGLIRVRETVLRLRRAKAMVIDTNEPDSRSLGSFFMNPVLSARQFKDVQQRFLASGNADAIPFFATPEGVKVPAAWLVEHAGYPRGTQREGVGISEKHALALVNRGGTTRAIVALAQEIQDAVERVFGIRLSIEPVVVTSPMNRTIT